MASISLSQDDRQGLSLIRLWYACGAAMLFAVAFVSLMPAPAIGVSDKLSHLLTYTLLSGWFCLLARRRTALAGSIVGLIAYGMMIEVLQGLTGYRYAEWGDVIANGAGCLLGALGYLRPLRRSFALVDHKLASLLRR
jgi:membrane associated rhomboid family serine protease